MAVTSVDIANEALQLMGGNQPALAGEFPNFTGNSALANAANLLYGPCVAAVGRQFAWDFARSTAALALSGNVAPYPWTLEYLYPDGAIEVWQVFPATETDPNDPLPVNYVTANAGVGAPQVQRRVIHTNLADALCIFNNNPAASTWDSTFRAAVVRLLASEFAMAIGGKPDTMQTLLESGSAFEQVAEARRD